MILEGACIITGLHFVYQLYSSPSRNYNFQKCSSICPDGPVGKGEDRSWYLVSRVALQDLQEGCYEK